MIIDELQDCIEQTPVIAAIQDNLWEAALQSPTEILFYLSANLLTIKQRITEAHKKSKNIFVHVDLADGIGRDKTGIEFLAKCGADGIISTRSQIIHYAKEHGLLTVQRFFVLDSKGVGGIYETLESSKPDMIEIMSGVIGKIIKKFSSENIPVIAGGLIETKQEIMSALGSGAIAVSTGKKTFGHYKIKYYLRD